MTTAEMNRRIAEMNPNKALHVERLVRWSSYTARELSDLCRVRLAHVNAIIQKVNCDLEGPIACRGMA
jgi:hypothetical protein